MKTQVATGRARNELPHFSVGHTFRGLPPDVNRITAEDMSGLRWVKPKIVVEVSFVATSRPLLVPRKGRMVDGHKDLLDQLEPRIDKKSLEQWKVATSDKTGAAASIATLPDKSDNPTTMRINQLAADLYPTVRAHRDAAKALKSSLKK